MDSGGSSPLSSAHSSRCSSPLSSLGASPSPPPEIYEMMRPSPQRPRISLHRRAPRHSDLPTPPPSQDNSLKGSPAPDAMETSDKDGQPPVKRRRVSTPRERTTEHLDLRQDRVKAAEQEQLDRLLHVIHKKRKIVVIAGAGISVSAGIPDFRSSTGLFNSLKAEHKIKGTGKDLFDASVYRDNNSTSSFHSMVSTMSRQTKAATPTRFHQMLATLAQEGRLLRLYSQNVDGIDTSLEPLSTVVPLRKDESGKWPKTVQLHGGLDKMVCSKCHELSDLDANLFDGPTAPLCTSCEEIDKLRTTELGKRSHGIGRLRPRMVLYNEHNPDDEAIGKVASEDLRRRPDAVIVVGTTLKVPGIQRITREMCGIVRDRRDGMAIWINNDPPPAGPQFADCWDLIVKGPADAIAERAALRHWDDVATASEFRAISDEDVDRSSAKKLSPVVPSGLAADDLTAIPGLPLSPGQINNSFRPPTEVPSTPHRKRSASQSPEYSPLTSRHTSVVSSVETSDGDSIAVASSFRDSGLLTPTKSNKGSPTTKVPFLLDRLKGSQKSNTTKATKAAAPKRKQSNVIHVKPAAQPPKKVGRPKGAKSKSANPSITSSFASSKPAASAKCLAAKKMPGTPAKDPSKLREVANCSDTLSPLSPSDPRNNKSPAMPRMLSSAEKSRSEKMTLGHVMN